MNSTIEQRQKHVNRMRASFAIEDMHADLADTELQTRYVNGSVSLADMLAYAVCFAKAHSPASHNA